MRIAPQFVLNQLKDILRQCPAENYNEPLQVLNGNSIGKHVRHILEFFICFLDATSTGEVNYDARQRDLRLENDLNFVLETIDRVDNGLRILDYGRNLLLKTLIEGNHYMVSTNVQREIVYLIEHSIHHFALIRIGIEQHFADVEIHPHFGIAASTIHHEHNVLTDLHT